MNKQAGFTLIEIIVSVMITMVIIMALAQFFISSSGFSRTAFLQEQATEGARLQLKRMTTSLREAEPNVLGNFPIDTANPQKLIYFSDMDNDGIAERIRYELTGTSLIQGITKATGTPLAYNLAEERTTTVSSLVRNGAVPIFTYYSGNYPAEPDPLSPANLQEVKYIQVHLVIDADPQKAPEAIDLTTQVQLRNLKTNLGQESST